LKELDQVGHALLALTPDEVAQFMCAQWSIVADVRPDLLNRLWPLMRGWVGDERLAPETLRAAKRVADAAVRAGQLHLTGTDRRMEVDVFGPLLAELRPSSASQARGQIYTPAAVSNVIARGVDVLPGESVYEPAAGTGGMLRAVAQTLRERGRDPAALRWVAVDIDEVAVACLAVNVMLWGLGTDVLLGVGNSLTDMPLR
jgi:hypothetical protein